MPILSIPHANNEKVAASAHKRQVMREPPPNARPAVTTEQPIIQLQGAQRVAPTTDDAPKVHIGEDNEKDTHGGAGNTATRTGQWATTAGATDSPKTDSKDEGSERPPPAINLVKSMPTEDSSTQLSSSDGSAKPPSLDGKSVASATTFALDEKESIRPDDSASLRAVEEEDVTSPPDSVAAGSRVGSDNGIARAFSEQLYEIQVQRGAPPGRFPNPIASGPHALFDPSQPPNGLRPMHQPMINGIPNLAGQHMSQSNPDEKLIEALESPRDRLFVLKLEQDFIDFIKDSR